MSELLPLLAGQKPDGELIFEEVEVEALEHTDQYQLLKSPAFCRDLAKGDVILRQAGGRFETLTRSGQLVVKIFIRSQALAIHEFFKLEIASLKGSIDHASDRLLVLSIPITSGFENIEKLMENGLDSVTDCAWFYGNVYDVDGQTPLNWWLSSHFNPES